MYWLIEDIEHIETICRIKHQVVYVDIIPCSHNIHPVENSICAIYLRFENDNKGYIISINHSETINFDLEVAERVLNSIEKINVRDRKEFLHYFPIKHCYQPPPSPHTYIPQLTQAHTQLYNRYPEIQNLNTIVPIVKHYEVCEQNFANFKGDINPFYNKAALVFNQLEHAGIKVDRTLFEQYFDKEVNEFIYTQYNLNTLTTRPSNAFGGINFSALNKDNGERECFIPRNDLFIEMDVNGMHPRIFAYILDYTFPDGDVYEFFSMVYKTDRQTSKEITFKQLYGGIWKEYLNHEFFLKSQEYTDKEWKHFTYKGYIKCPISNHKLYQNELESMNPQKLLNYILQSTETAINVIILYNVLKRIKGYKSKIVLYVYDSILLDVTQDEADNIIQIITQEYNKFNLPLTIKIGKNYNNLKVSS
jgi:hypothetical protein